VSFVLTYTLPGHDLSQLHDELLAAIPGLRPVDGPNGYPVPRLAVEGEGPTVRLTVPDGTVEAEVAAVVAAHAPQAVYDPDARLREVQALRRVALVRGGLQIAKARVAAAGTLDELKDAVLLALEEVSR